MRRFLVPALAIALLAAAGTSDARAYHETLQVWVNGVRMSPQQILALEQLYQMPFQSGAYTIDSRGVLSRSSSSQSSPYDRSYSNQGYNRQGPFGGSMSDGNCAFVNGIPVGNCN